MSKNKRNNNAQKNGTRNNRASFRLADIHLTYRTRAFREHVYSDLKTRAQDNPCR